jgi:hypothetical protein
MLFVILGAFLTANLPAYAAIEPNYYVREPGQVPFYKSSTSHFPSGSTTLDNLKKQLVKSESVSSKYYQWNKIFFAQDELMPLFATHLSKFVIENSTNKRLKVADTNTLSLQVADPAQPGIVRKISLSDVRADAYDAGFAMALKDVYLKTQASEKSAIQTTIPQGTRFEVQQYDSNFALVQYQNYTGWVSLSEIITKYDLASFVFAGREWHQVRSRQFDFILTKSKKKIPLNNIHGVITPDHIGIIASSTQKIPLWSKVKVTKSSVAGWQQSKLKEHGLVWWKPNKEFGQIFYSIDELLKKDISSVSFHPQEPLKGILSSDGIYITENGSQWRKLAQFENFNGPVHYFNDALLFVGNFRSVDGGATFDNYIQIDKLASAIEFQYGFVPKRMQVKKIETIAPFKMKIEIDTGIRRIKMESPLFAQDWKAAKS